MTIEPFMWATFCDDVRQEAGNKISFMGVYGPNLIVPSIPTTLLKLCCVLNLRVPAESPPRSVVFRLLRQDEVLVETDLSAAVAEGTATAIPHKGADSLVLTISTIAQLVNFPITQPCLLKTRAMIDGKELRGGALELIAAE